MRFIKLLFPRMMHAWSLSILQDTGEENNYLDFFRACFISNNFASRNNDLFAYKADGNFLS